MKRFLLLAMTFIMIFSFAACANTSFLSDDEIMDISKNPEATITLKYDLDDGLGERKVVLVYELFYKEAPSTVANFIQLADEGYYDDKIIDWANINPTAGQLSYISGGRYKLNENGEVIDDAKNYSIKGEFKQNQWAKNTHKHGYGALVMDRDYGDGPLFDSASTRFYMTLNDNYDRQGNYCVFGQLKSSQITIGSTTYPASNSLHNQFLLDMENLDTEAKIITNTGISLTQAPVHNIYMTVKVEKFGEDYSRSRVIKM